MLQSILSELDTTCVSILGDWNADISDDSYIFAGHLRQFCSDTGLLLSMRLIYLVILLLTLVNDGTQRHG